MPSLQPHSPLSLQRKDPPAALASANGRAPVPLLRPQEFYRELDAVRPALMAYARALARHREDAEDLFQDCVVRLLGACASFAPGSCFRAWAFTILRNRFLSDCVVRRRRFVSLDAEQWPEVSVGATQSHQLEVADLWRQFATLSAPARRLLILAAEGEAPYQAIAQADGCALGTVKSRVHRARAQLRERIAADCH